MTVITFIQHDGSERIVDGDVGLSLMETALKHDVPGIDADCGGGAICGTCHCFVEVSGDLPAPDSQETAMLGLRPDRAENSRLACQIVVSDGMADITVRLPEFQM
jgi:2Fe-2S ferredoxin